MAHTTRQRIAVVTDSTAYLPADLVDEYGIHVVPMILMLEGNSWLDGVQIDPPAFYELLRITSSFPTTSQPNVATFQELFAELSEEYEGIVAILVSGKLSGTVASALGAADNLPDVQIEVIDSEGTSMMLGFQALAAAKAAVAGGDLETVADAARALIKRMHLYFVLGTLEYLRRGGRIGNAAWLLGSVLNLKPILEFREGVIEPVAKVRTRAKALERVYQLIRERVAEGDKVHMGVINVAAQEEADHFREELVARFHPVELIEVECSPAIGAHAGPGTVGVAFYVE